MEIGGKPLLAGTDAETGVPDGRCRKGPGLAGTLDRESGSRVIDHGRVQSGLHEELVRIDAMAPYGTPQDSRSRCQQGIAHQGLVMCEARVSAILARGHKECKSGKRA